MVFEKKKQFFFPFYDREIVGKIIDFESGQRRKVANFTTPVCFLHWYESFSNACCGVIEMYLALCVILQIMTSLLRDTVQVRNNIHISMQQCICTESIRIECDVRAVRNMVFNEVHTQLLFTSDQFFFFLLF